LTSIWGCSSGWPCWAEAAGTQGGDERLDARRLKHLWIPGETLRLDRSGKRHFSVFVSASARWAMVGLRCCRGWATPSSAARYGRKVWKWCVNAGPARRDLVRRGPQPHAQQCIRRAFVGRKPTLMALLRASVVENEMSRQRLLSEMTGGQDVLMQPGVPRRLLSRGHATSCPELSLPDYLIGAWNRRNLRQVIPGGGSEWSGV